MREDGRWDGMGWTLQKNGNKPDLILGVKRPGRNRIQWRSGGGGVQGMEMWGNYVTG